MQASGGKDDDDFGVELEWPGELSEPLYVRAAPSVQQQTPPAAELAPEPMPAPQSQPAEVAPRPPTPDPLSAIEHLVQSSDQGTPAALAAIVARIDVLTATTTTFRNMISEQMRGYLTQLADAADAKADHRRAARDRAVEQIAADLAGTWQQIQDVSRSVEGLAHTLETGFEEISERLAELTDEVTAIRRRTPVRPRDGEPARDKARSARRGAQST